MTDEHCRYAPVVADEKVVAMLSLGDILSNTVNWIITTQDRTIHHVEGHHVEDYISDNYPNDLPYGLLLYGGR